VKFVFNTLFNKQRTYEYEDIYLSFVKMTHICVVTVLNNQVMLILIYEYSTKTLLLF